METLLFKYGECEKTFFDQNGVCNCGSNDTYQLNEIKSKTNWPYVNGCFRD